jgi:hypothetical protein
MASDLDHSFRPPPEAEAFYVEGLNLLARSGEPFLLSGTYAVTAYTGVVRPTKDLDVFCKAGDCPRILAYFRARGFDVSVEDERWLARVIRGRFFFDVIFNGKCASIPVTDAWFEAAPLMEIYGTPVRVTPPTEMIWSKMYVQDRERFDGADIAHLILKQHAHVDWTRLLSLMEPHWEVLLAHLLNFRYIYPADRDAVPAWLFRELLSRLMVQLDAPLPRTRICRGRLFSPIDYAPDVFDWGFADIVGCGPDDRLGIRH